MKKRLFAALLMLAALLPAVALGRLAVRAAPDIIFIVTDYRVCQPDSSAMPYFSGGTLMVPASIFSDIGLSVTESKTQLIIARFDRILYYSAASGLLTDQNGTVYPASRSPVYRSGRWFVSASLVAELTGTDYGYYAAEPYPFIRISEGGTAFLEQQFMRTYPDIARRYAESYLGISSGSEQTTAPPAKTANVCLIADLPGDLSAAADLLSEAGAKAVFLSDGRDSPALLRSLAVAGNGFVLPRGSERDASMRIFSAVFRRPRLVLCAKNESPDEGYIAVRADMELENGSGYELADLGALLDRAAAAPVKLRVSSLRALSNLLDYLSDENISYILLSDAAIY